MTRTKIWHLCNVVLFTSLIHLLTLQKVTVGRYATKQELCYLTLTGWFNANWNFLSCNVKPGPFETRIGPRLIIRAKGLLIVFTLKLLIDQTYYELRTSTYPRGLTGITGIQGLLFKVQKNLLYPNDKLVWFQWQDEPWFLTTGFYQSIMTKIRAPKKCFYRLYF